MNFNFLDGWKTYLAALGLLGLSFWQFSQGQFELGTQSFMAALAAFGLRQAIDKPVVVKEEEKK